MFIEFPNLTNYEPAPGVVIRTVKSISILLTVLLLAGATIGFAGRKAVVITGRAVDERGAPISGAIITLYYSPCKNCIDHILPATFSFPDGVFAIDASDITGRGLKLFIAEPVPKGFWSPFGGPPFERLSHLPTFQGIPIRLRKGKVQPNLGEVLVRVRYSKVTIELAKVLGEQYKPSPEASKSLTVKMLDQQRRVIYDGRLPEVAFDPTGASLNLALTEGKWSLEFSLGDKNKGTSSPCLHINVDSLGHTKLTKCAEAQ